MVSFVLNSSGGGKPMYKFVAAVIWVVMVVIGFLPPETTKGLPGLLWWIVAPIPALFLIWRYSVTKSYQENRFLLLLLFLLFADGLAYGGIEFGAGARLHELERIAAGVIITVSTIFMAIGETIFYRYIFFRQNR